MPDRPERHPPAPHVRLRATRDDDLPVFHEHQSDAVAHHMAAFTRERAPLARDVFLERWRALLRHPTNAVRTILCDEAVAGSLGCYERDGRLEVTYWIGRAFWGRGVATAAVRAWLLEDPRRPLYAGAVADNVASLRVLENCGFRRIGTERGFAPARGAEVEEVRMVLEA